MEIRDRYEQMEERLTKLCPYCRGNGCKACHATGEVKPTSAQVWDAIEAAEAERVEDVAR